MYRSTVTPSWKTSLTSQTDRLSSMNQFISFTEVTDDSLRESPPTPRGFAELSTHDRTTRVWHCSSGHISPHGWQAWARHKRLEGSPLSSDRDRWYNRNPSKNTNLCNHMAVYYFDRGQPSSHYHAVFTFCRRHLLWLHSAYFDPKVLIICIVTHSRAKMNTPRSSFASWVTMRILALTEDCSWMPMIKE